MSSILKILCFFENIGLNRIQMSMTIIRKIHLAHCKRGPAICEKCREMNIERICLLDIDPPNAGLIQRRTMQFEVGGELVWREFDVLRSFESVDKALDYAEKHGVKDVSLD